MVVTMVWALPKEGGRGSFSGSNKESQQSGQSDFFVIYVLTDLGSILPRGLLLNPYTQVKVLSIMLSIVNLYFFSNHLPYVSLYIYISRKVLNFDSFHNLSNFILTYHLSSGSCLLSVNSLIVGCSFLKHT